MRIVAVSSGASTQKRDVDLSPAKVVYRGGRGALGVERGSGDRSGANPGPVAVPFVGQGWEGRAAILYSAQYYTSSFWLEMFA